MKKQLYGLHMEEVFMEQLAGFVHQHLPSHVYKLHKVLNGLKQAQQAWFHCLTQALLDLGFAGSLKLIANLQREFKLKDLGDLSYFLGVHVHHESQVIHQDQAKYIIELLERVNMLGAYLVRNSRAELY